MFQPILSKDIPKSNPWMEKYLQLGIKYTKDANLLETRPLHAPKTALNIFQEQTDYVSTTVSELDECFANGLQTKQIVEVTGEPGTGKTQLCYRIAVNLLSMNKDSTVVFLSAGNNISRQRLEQLASYLTDDIHSILCRIKVIDIIDSTDLMASIHYLKSYLMNNKMKLLIIDSLFLSLKVIDYQDRNDLVYKLFGELQDLAIRNSFLVLVTNSHTARFGFEDENSMAALGGSYFHRVNVRIQLTKDNGKFNALVIKCPLIASKEPISFTIE